jgi:two-component system chemotaxis response regulator CheY
MKLCLVVDDSRAVRKIARGILEALKFTVAEAQDGQAALKVCEDTMPDAILLDWNMPVMNGLEFLYALRERTDGERPFVVFCTTQSSLSSIQEAISAGADDYIMKPFDNVILESKFAPAGLP